MFKQEKEMLKQEKKMRKWKEKRWKRINTGMERTVAFLAVLVCFVCSVLEVLEKGDKRFTLEKLMTRRGEAPK